MVRSKKRGLIHLLLALLFLIPVSMRIHAQEFVDPDREVSLSVVFKENGTPISGASFVLYKVADSDESTNLTPTADFRSVPVHFEGVSQEQYKDMALTLAGYAGGISPLARAVTDSEGCARFEQIKAGAGMYLVLAENYVNGKSTYQFTPSLVFLPGSEDMRNTWNYDVTIKPKFTRIDAPDTITLKVLKIWNDSKDTSKRPAEIKVDLLKDGNVHETVVLNAENNWRYTFSDLDVQHNWMVREHPINGYTVLVEKQGITFTITNTWIPNVPPGTPSRPFTPFTAQLWWPVLVIAVLGIGLIYRGRRKSL